MIQINMMKMNLKILMKKIQIKKKKKKMIKKKKK